MTGHLALIRGNENHIGGYNLIFVLLFFWFELWSLLVSRGRAQYIYIYIYIYKETLGKIGVHFLNVGVHV